MWWLVDDGRFNELKRATAVMGLLSGQTSFSYDANNNLRSLTAALTHSTAYTYDASDRVATRIVKLTSAVSR